MRSYGIIDIVDNLIGPIEPTGCHSTDSRRLNNLEEAISLVDRLLIDMDNLYHIHKDSHEQSVQHIVQRCEEFLKSLEYYGGNEDGN